MCIYGNCLEGGAREQGNLLSKGGSVSCAQLHLSVFGMCRRLKPAPLTHNYDSYFVNLVDKSVEFLWQK